MINIKIDKDVSDKIYEHLQNYNVSTDVNEYEAMIVSGTKVLSKDFPPNLCAIAKSGIKTDNVPIKECNKLGIAVFNSPGAGANGIKELVLGGMLLASLNLVEACNYAKDTHKDKKRHFLGKELMGKKLGVVGMGTVGTLVANMGCSLGMKVYGYDQSLSVESALILNQNVTTVLNLDNLFSECDYITLHLPAIQKTVNFVNTKYFSIMKKDTVLLNYSHKSIVNTKALINAINQGTIANYVTDFEVEELKSNDKVIITPSLMGQTPESLDKGGVMAAKVLHSFLRYGNVKNSVNVPNCALPYNDNPRLTFVHKNEINMVGQITKILAMENLNIEDMINKGLRGIAYTIIDVNKIPSDEILEKLRKVDNMLQVRLIKP